MSKKEQLVFRIIEDYRAGRISRKEAALKLGVSEKTIQRKAKRLREKGLEGIKHGNCGQSPVNKKPQAMREEFLELYRTHYFDFNFVHALEMIKANHEKQVSYSTFRSWCRAEGLGKVKKRRVSKGRMARERCASEGFMLQMDGSTHAWNGKDKWTLIALIDDATSKIPAAEFHPSETTWGCMSVLQKTILLNGVPEFILTDEAGWSSGSAKRRHFSQFVRACEELDIKVITTPSAESKGRIERFNRTAQDRLVPEMRLLGIHGMADSNRYLDQCFIPQWGEQRTVEPTASTKRYRDLPKDVDLKDIFCLKETRQINRDHTISYGNERYRIDPTDLGCLYRKQVTVHEYEDKSIAIFYGRKRLPMKKIVPPKRIWKKAS